MTNAHKAAVDALVEQRARAMDKTVLLESHLWAAEFLLHRCAKLLPRLIAERPYESVARDTLCEEIREFLTEPREHPGAGVVDDSAWPKDPLGSGGDDVPMASSGDAGAEGQAF